VKIGSSLVILMSEVVFVRLLDHGDDQHEEERHQPAGPVHRRVRDDEGQDQSHQEINIGYPPNYNKKRNKDY
jgi:hypothetical protein